MHPNQRRRNHRNCQSQHSKMAKSAIISNASCDPNDNININSNSNQHLHNSDDSDTSTQNTKKKKTLMPPSSKTVVGRALGSELYRDENISKSLKQSSSSSSSDHGVGSALTDTPISTAPGSPQMYVFSFFFFLFLFLFINKCILAVTCALGILFLLV